MPTDRVHCCLCCACCGGVLRSVVGHCSRWSAVWPCACCGALHQLEFRVVVRSL